MFIKDHQSTGMLHSVRQ